MPRDNIFQRLAKHNTVFLDVDRIDKLCREVNIVHLQGISSNVVGHSYTSSYYTMEKYIDDFCFSHWKNRGHCLNFRDFLISVNYDNLLRAAKAHVDDFLTFAELILNFIKLTKSPPPIMSKASEISRHFTPDFSLLCTILDDDITVLNQKVVYDEQHEQVLLIEDKPEVTTVAEIVEPPFAFDIVRYNHRSFVGNIEDKKTILLRMGSDLEPKRNDIKHLNSQLADDIFFMLNTLNIRHNNCDPTNASNYKKHVAEMSKTDLERWYDELYQMMLLAYLELDQQERNRRVRSLKSSIEGAN